MTEKYQLFFEVLSLADPRERKEFLKNRCGERIGLYDELNELLFHLESIENNGSAAESAQYPIGQILGNRYLIKSKLGQGGIGEIYLAEDTRLYSRPVVVKCLLDASHSNQYLVRKFKHESEALSRIRHPGVVAVFDLGELPDGKPYFVMEFVEGKMLAQEITSGGLDFGRAAAILRQVAQALFAAHFEGVIHRDLKPANVILRTLNDGTEHIKLIDFGIAKISNPQSADSTQTPLVIGSPSYMAPEQLEKGPVTPASDVYALGVLAYELLTGQCPLVIDKDSDFWMSELLSMQRAAAYIAPRKWRAELPDKAQETILKALSYKAEDRQQQIFEFGEELYRALLLEGEPIAPVRQVELATTVADVGLPETTCATNIATEKFERLWKTATLTDKIRPILSDKALEEKTERFRGLGSKPRKAQYAYRLGSEICLAFDFNLQTVWRGLGAKPSGDRYLTLLDEGSEGIIYCLCPSLFAPSTLLTADRFYLPQEGSTYPVFELSGSTGREKLLAIITDEPLGLDWLTQNPDEPARLLSSGDLEDLFARLEQMGENRWRVWSSYFEVID